MDIGIIVNCHSNSESFPAEYLHQINGCAVLSYVVERIRKATLINPTIALTACDISDDPMLSYCRRSGLKYFYNTPNNVVDNLLACAETEGWGYLVFIKGRNLFLDVNTLREMLAIVRTNCFDFVTNVPEATFPKGMEIEIARTTCYSELFNNPADSSNLDYDASWLFECSEAEKRYVYKNDNCPDAANLTLTLESPEGLENARRLISFEQSSPFDIGLSEIYDFLVRKQPALSPWKGPAGPLMIAEIGGNHEGNFEVAKKMTELAIGCGSDCVKFQLYRGDTLVSPVESPDRHCHFKKFELTRNQHIYLAEMCREANTLYTASVWDMEMLEWIDPYLDFYKVGSGDLTAWPILEEFARREKPILISTGLATMDEVMQTIRFIQRSNPCYNDFDMLCVMQCTSMYPIPDEDANLRVINSLRKNTKVSVGYSDHTVGMAALRAAAAMGASVLEFHFTDTRECKDFRDHKVSLVPDEVKCIKEEIAQIKALHGDGVKLPQQSELRNKHEVLFRRAVYLQSSIKAGNTITADDIVYLRPAHGTDARDSELIIGSKALRNLEPYTVLKPGVDYLPS